MRAKRKNPSIQTIEDANLAIALIGSSRRDLIRIEADMNDALAQAKARYEEEAAPLARTIEANIAVLREYCEQHREEYGIAKTVVFAAGEVSWRTRPPMVKVRSVKRAIAWIIERKWREFLRVKHDLNKEAMLARPERAAQIPGVKIGSEGETFVVKPFESELEEVA